MGNDRWRRRGCSPRAKAHGSPGPDVATGDLDGNGLNDVIGSLWVGGGKLVGLLQGPTKGD